MGAGNAGTMRRVDAHFEVFVSVIHSEWDGVGVKPHIEVPPEAALERAQQIAAERLAERAKNQQDQEGLRYSQTPHVFELTRSSSRFETRRLMQQKRLT